MRNEKAVEDAAVERDWRLFLIDRGLVALLRKGIYYPHTGVVCFGWGAELSHRGGRDALLTVDEESALLDALPEAPFEYELRTDTGERERDGGPPRVRVRHSGGGSGGTK